MINLLSPGNKRSLRAARANVLLRRYVTFFLSAVILMVAIFGIGYYITYQDRLRAEALASERELKIQKYSKVRTQAEQFSSNLTAAKTILANEVVFSDLIVSITKILPSGTVLTDLSITTEDLGKEIGINARTKDSDQSPLRLKAKLEESDLFSDVKVANISRSAPAAAGSTPASGVEAAYPVEVKIMATLSPTAGKRTAGAKP